MLIKWIKKKVLKSIINDLKKEMPHLKEEALKLLEVVLDENTTDTTESDIQDELDTTTSKSDEANTDILE